MGDDKLLVVRPIVTNAKPIRAMADVSNPKPVHVEAGDPDYLMYLEETREDGALVVFNVDNSDSPDAKVKKVNTVQDQDALNDVLEIEWCDVSDPKSSTKTFVDPDYKMFMENMKIDGHFFSLELHEKDGSSEILEYEKDVYQKEYWGKSTGDNVENASGKHTRDLVVYGEDTVTKSLRENINKGKEKEVINLVSSNEKKNALVGRERISRESNKSMATKSRSVVQRGDDVQIVAIKNANEIDKHTVSKVNKNERPLDLDDGHEMEYLRKSKRSKYKMVERRRSLTRINNVSKVKEENLVWDSDVAMVKGRRQMVQVRNRVYIPNLQPPTNYEENFGKYAEIKKEYDDSFNYEEMDNGHASDLEIVDMDDQQNLSRFEVDVESNSDCDNVSDSDIRIRRTRSMARKAAGSNCFSKDVSVMRNQNMTDVGGDCSGLAKKRKCGVGRNIGKCLLKKRKIDGGDQGKRRSSVVEVESVRDCGDMLNRDYDIWLRDVLVTEDGMVYNEMRCDIENGNGDESAGANRPRTRTLTGKIGLKSMLRKISTRKNPEHSVEKKVGGGGGCSVKVEKSRAQEFSRWNRREKPKNVRGNGADTKQSGIVKVERAYDIWLRDYVVGEDAMRVRYNGKGCDLGKDNVGASSEAEVEVLDRDPDCAEWNYTSVGESNVLDASMEEDEIQYIGERRKPENPQFRKDVVKILGRPYNEKEYKNLWLQVKKRKPTQGHRDLRGGLKTYSTDTMGRSYLDEYDECRCVRYNFLVLIPPTNRTRR